MSLRIIFLLYFCMGKLIKKTYEDILSMDKNNSTEKTGGQPAYRSMVNPKILDEMENKILDIIVMQKKYRDRNYSAAKLAEALGTNTRYISAVVNGRFHCNYASFINKFRVQEAMTILIDKRFRDLKMEQVGDMVGFANRQSFYAAFYKAVKMTPRAYRSKYLSKTAPKTRASKKSGQRDQEAGQ